MQYVNDINIMEAIVHVLDQNADEPILNDFKLDLNEDVYKFIYKHVEKNIKSKNLKYAVFNKDILVKEETQAYLTGVNDNFIKLSQSLAREMFNIMKASATIPSCDLLIVSISTDQGTMIGILKLDFIKNFTHNIDFKNNKVGIGLIEHLTGLPSSAQKVQKCAFIKSVRENEDVNVFIIDKKKNITEEDMYEADYFTKNYIGCREILNDRDNTQQFIEKTEKWIRSNILNADEQMEIRTKVKEYLKNEEVVKIDKFAETLNSYGEGAADNYRVFLNSYCKEEFKLDTVYLEGINKTKIKIDKDIALSIKLESYLDSDKMEVVKNGDGSINIVLKNIKSYLEE